MSLENDLAYLRGVMKDDEGNGGPYDRYVVAARLVLEKTDAMQEHAQQVPGMGMLFKTIGDEFRQIVVDAVLFGRDELPHQEHG
jgi:hypothetical protein